MLMDVFSLFCRENTSISISLIAPYCYRYLIRNGQRDRAWGSASFKHPEKMRRGVLFLTSPLVSMLAVSEFR
jgi:hypothetical protein